MALTRDEERNLRRMMSDFRELRRVVGELQTYILTGAIPCGNALPVTQGISEGEARGSLHDVMRVAAEATSEGSLDRVAIRHNAKMVDQYGVVDNVSFVRVEATSSTNFYPDRDYWHQL